jgi:cysteinyl-tRNA synthetase
MAKYWMHNGFVQVEGKKMSKSEGNFVTIKQLLRERVFGQRQWSGAVLRMAMLSTHYRQPIDWTVRGLENAEARLERWRAFAGLATSRKVSHDFSVELLSILKDDINSPAAFAKIDEVIEKRPHSEELQFSVFLFMRLVGLKRQQTKVSTLLGKTLALLSSISSLTQQDVKNIAYTVATSDRFADQSLKPEAKLAAALKAVNELVSPITSEMSFNANQQKLQFISEFQLKTPERDVAIQRMITARLEARKAKNWAESDRLRDELAAMGVTIKDNKDGTTTWEIKR